MKEFKYQKYDYSVLYPYINIPKDCIIRNAKVEDGVVYMNIDFASNELTIQFNINDLITDET